MPQQELSERSEGGKKFLHKTLTVLMRKAAQFDRESQQVMLQRKEQEAQEEQEGFVKLAKHFTNDVDFKKMLLKKKDVFTSPPRGKKPENSLAVPEGVFMSPQSQSTQKSASLRE